MFDTAGAAEAARNELLAQGLSSSDVTVHGTGSAGTAVGDDRSFWDELKGLFVPDDDRYAYAEGIRRGGYLLSVRVPEGGEAEVEQVLERYEPVDLDTRESEWRAGGWQGYQGTVADQDAVAGRNAAYAAYSTDANSPMTDAGDQSGATSATTGMSSVTEGGELRARSGAARLGTTSATMAASGEEVIPVMEEQLRVGKREVGRGSVRVRSYVVERPVEEQVELRQERVTIERRPVDRELQPGDAAFKEQTIEAVERGEEAVVSKTARVVEEIGIRKDVERETETVRDTVRRQEVEVEDERTARGDVASGTEVSGTDQVGTSRTATDRVVD
jgi:uncharacterized protein (TIGR02271 family)